MIKSSINNYENKASREVFTIECKDIVLREFKMDDLDELYALTLQPEITDNLPDWIGTKDQYRDWLENKYIKGNKEFFNAIPYVDDNWVIFGIILKETNEFIGWCCNGPSDDLANPNREIGYAISRYHRNKGYTTQAVQAVIKYIFENTTVEVMNAMALIDNGSSNKVIEKCGFKYVGDMKIGKRDFHHYKLSKNEK